MTNTVQKLPTRIIHAITAENLSSDNVIYYDERQGWVYKRLSDDLNNTSRQNLSEVQSSSLVQNARPLESLGPFGTQPTDVSVIIEPGEVIYRTKSFNMILSDLTQYTVVECLGQHAPLAPITLHGTARSVSYIPHDATHFCWVYPPIELSELCEKIKQTIDKKVAMGDLSCTFLAFGGFVYFRINEYNNYIMLQANALVKADNGLVFHGPHDWQSAYTACLAKNGRFQDVTVSSLIDLGIKYYCFINPNEKLCSSIEGQSDWAPARNGGFVYLYGSPGTPHPLDRYFSIADAPITEQISTQVMPFSLIRNPHITVEGSSSSLPPPSSNIDKDRFNCSICLDQTIQCILIPSNGGLESNIICQFSEQNQTVFWTGNFVLGNIEFNHSRNEKMKLKRIDVELIGRLAYKNIFADNTYKSTRNTRHMIFFSQRLNLNFSNAKSDFLLPRGNYKWPFRFFLNDSLPPTLKKRQYLDSFIYYFIQITFVRREWYKRNIKKIIPIVVKYMSSPVDEMKVEAQEKNQKDVHLHVILHKSTIAVGNNVSFDIEIQNPKEVLINRISVTLAQHLKLGPAVHRRVDILNETLKTINHFQNSHLHKNFHFFIPRTIPPTFSFHYPMKSKEQPIIVNYELHFEAHLSGFSTNIRLKLPLVITDHPQNN
ncbi:unnamed protein product [Adineta steineri]|uniref:Arrestin C-terminal-like domain-containing protein n=1 Tax=Adineta steineri TaxID=433720 RepID=A0A814ISV8_9BILA|nr:unnamed protein product [Adineta steineri]CAF1403634.1 unnamed protein product [Adineta steineri]